MTRPTDSSATLNEGHALYTAGLVFAGLAFADNTFWDFKGRSAAPNTPVQAGYTNGSDKISTGSGSIEAYGGSSPTDNTSVYLTTNGSGALSFTDYLTVDELTGNAWTIFMEGGYADGVSPVMFDSHESGAGNGFLGRFDDGVAVVDGLMAWYNQTAVSSASDAVNTGGHNKNHRVMITSDGTNVRYYTKNSSTPFTTSAVNASITGHANRRVRILSRYDQATSFGYNGRVGVVYVWNATLTGANYQTLWDDPYVFFTSAAGQPSTRRLGGIRHGRPGGAPGVNVFNRAFEYLRNRRIFLPSLRLEPAA